MMAIKIGVIGYGVRIDMLMDQLSELCADARVTAVADKNPDRVKELMRKDGSDQIQHQMEIDTIDGLFRKCPMDPDKINFYENAEEMIEREELDGVMVGTRCNSHAYFAKMVLDKDIPLYLEKPVGICREDLELLKECDKNKKVPVVVSFPLII